MVQSGYNANESVDCERCLSFYWHHHHIESEEYMVGCCRFLKAAIVRITKCYVYRPVRKAKRGKANDNQVKVKE